MADTRIKPAARARLIRLATAVEKINAANSVTSARNHALRDERTRLSQELEPINRWLQREAWKLNKQASEQERAEIKKQQDRAAELETRLAEIKAEFEEIRAGFEERNTLLAGFSDPLREIVRATGKGRAELGIEFGHDAPAHPGAIRI
jgi:predicted RNase H-like nuclease (RuvC/YqgF family)